MNNLYFLDQHKLRPEDVGRWKFVALSVSKHVGFFYQDGIKGFNQSKVCKTSTLNCSIWYMRRYSDSWFI